LEVSKNSEMLVTGKLTSGSSFNLLTGLPVLLTGEPDYDLSAVLKSDLTGQSVNSSALSHKFCIVVNTVRNYGIITIPHWFDRVCRPTYA